MGSCSSSFPCAHRPSIGSAAVQCIDQGVGNFVGGFSSWQTFVSWLLRPNGTNFRMQSSDSPSDAGEENRARNQQIGIDPFRCGVALLAETSGQVPKEIMAEIRGESPVEGLACCSIIFLVPTPKPRRHSEALSGTEEYCSSCRMLHTDI